MHEVELDFLVSHIGILVFINVEMEHTGVLLYVSLRNLSKRFLSC